MRKISFFRISKKVCTLLFMLFLLTSLNSCYIVRYNKLKKDYAQLRKEYLKENSKMLAAKQKYTQKKDSVALLRQQISKSITTYKVNNSITDSLSKIIVAKPGKYWTENQIATCNTARDIKQLNKDEKDIYLYLNLARRYPAAFAELHIEPFTSRYSLPNYNDSTYLNVDTNAMWFQSYYANSLYLRMKKMQPLDLLYFDKQCWESAECHSISVGKAGLITHERQNGCKSYFSGECCHYGRSDALEIIIDLLIDSNVVSLGHRNICLGSYSGLGVSMKPHITWRVNTTLDFK